MTDRMADDITVWWQPHPLAASERRHVVVPAGVTLAAAIDSVTAAPPAVVRWNGETIAACDRWLTLTHGVVHIVQEVPEGGQAGTIIQGVLGVINVAAGAYTGNYFQVAAGVALIAGAAYGAHQAAEAEQVSRYGRDAQPKSRSLAYDGLRNRADPWGAVPRILGRHRATPPYAAVPYTEVDGQISRITAVFALSYGPVEIEDIRIGETALDQFSAELQYRRGYLPSMITDRGAWAPSSGLPAAATFGDRWTVGVAGSTAGRTWAAGETITFNGLGAASELSSWDIDDDKPISLYPNDVYQDTLTQRLEYEESAVVRTTQVDADEISIDLSFPRGLYKISRPKMNYTQTRIDVTISYRLTGTAEWTALPKQSVKAEQTNPRFWSYRWSVPRGQYDVAIAIGNRPQTNNDIIVDETWWTALRTITHETAIAAPGVAMLALRLSPTDLSNGVLDEITAVVTSIARDWDGAHWVWRPTRNPASLAIHAMQVAPARPVLDTLIDWPAFAAWHTRCAADGLLFDQYVDFEETRAAALQRIARVGLAVIGRSRSGLVAPYLDQAGAPVAALITSRNSAQHTQTLSWDRVPDAIRVAYVDADAGYATQEVLVYGDGLDAGSAADIRQLDIPGVTSRDLAYRLGRHAWAIAARRRAHRTCVVDIDTPVDVMSRVVMASDAIEHMTVSGLVTDLVIDNEQIVAIVGDTGLVWDGLEAQAVIVHGASGPPALDAWPIRLDAPGTHRTFPLVAPVPEGTVTVGTLYIVGPARQEVSDWLVAQIEPEPDFRMRLTCVPYAPEIFGAGAGALPPAPARIISRVLPSPVVIAVRSDATVMVQTPSGGLDARIAIAVAPVQGAVGVRTVARYRRAGADADAAWAVASRAMTDGLGVVISGVDDGETYEIMLRHEADGWFPSRWTATMSTIAIGEGGAPGPLVDLSIVVQGSMVLARWAPIAEADVRVGGWIEWRHGEAGEQWGNSVPIGASSRGADTSALLPYRPGAYHGRVYDRGGRAAADVNTIVIAVGQEITPYGTPTIVWESPAWSGVHDGTEIVLAGASAALTLTSDGGSSWDDVPDIDDVPNIDAVGAGDDAATIVDSGTYRWARRLDMGAVQRMRVMVRVTVMTSTIGDAIARRTTPVIEWPPMGGDGMTVAGDVETWGAATQDDPASPTAVWSDLFRLDSAHLTARGVGRLETRIVARDRPSQILITALGIEAAVVV